MNKLITIITALAILLISNQCAAETKPIEDRLASLEAEAKNLHAIIDYAKIFFAVVGVGAVPAAWKAITWVRERSRGAIERALTEYGLSWADLSEVVQRGEQQTRIRRQSKILVIAPDARREIQVALQREGFHHVHVMMPGQPAVEAGRLAELVVFGGWSGEMEEVARDLGRDDLLIFTGTARVAIPEDLAGRVMLANTNLTLGMHAAALLVRHDARKAMVGS